VAIIATRVCGNRVIFRLSSNATDRAISVRIYLRTLDILFGNVFIEMGIIGLVGGKVSQCISIITEIKEFFWNLEDIRV
jgi:hypothetical protein